METRPPLPSCGHRIAVILVNFNSGGLLRQALLSLAQQTRAPDEILVIDNGSCEDLRQVCADLPLPQLTLHRLPRNIGFAAANNRAADLCRADWIALLNCDAAAAPDWLAQMEAAAARHPGCRAFASAQLRMSDPDQIDGAGDVLSGLGLVWRGGFGQPRATLPQEAEVFGPCAAGAFFHRATFLQFGGFEEAFFCYLEDLDLAYRMQLAGAPCIFVPAARLLHLGGGSCGRHSAWSLELSARNRIFLLLRNTPLLLLLLTAPLLGLGLGLGWLQGLLHGRGGAVLRGYGAALAQLPQLWRARQRLAPPLWPPSRVIGLMAWNPFDLLSRKARTRPLASPEPPVPRAIAALPQAKSPAKLLQEN